MRLVAERTTIPVPRVHRVESDEDGRVLKIHMDYMPGTPLDRAWPSMTDTQKKSVAEDLRNYVDQLRALKGDYIGAADHGQAVIGQRTVFHEGGPFDNEGEFNEFLFSKIISRVPQTFRYHAMKTFKDSHQIMFTHGDLAPRNILVLDGHVTALLDWEHAGWYPEYWEYVKAYRDFNAVPSWLDYVDTILPPRYSEEIVAMSYLSQYSH
ncbi:kinase-like protein [Aspergillus ellipticus CBS 707.79]|uniref:non-specific serine/threonine protein kinase n=1 Tax=Aspergillus ellipticus CBS 707.79 TaxID=1448320 RepID=A0A319DP55_9EURO|nr:kinase-like protein [Aspergillus ellipticus CBS 707.79]